MSRAADETTTPVVGVDLPTLTWTAGFEVWNRFAAVNDEFVPIHMDDEQGRAAGYDGAFGMGYLQWSWVHDVLREFVGDRGRIERVQGSFRAPSLKGVEVTAGGRVTGVSTRDGRTVVDVEVWTRTEDGTPLFPGTAVVSFPAG
jgi:acyl dehydratase